jgi:ABC-type dipeptide/oligopeptide/nickel transport system ATPase component
VLIADEPTTALDVTIQAEILELLRELRERRGMALSSSRTTSAWSPQQADEVAIMYAGRIVERASVLDDLRPSAPSLHAGALPLDARRRRAAGAARHDTGPGARPAPSPERMHVPRPAARARSTTVAVSFPPLEEKAPAHLAACIRV